MTTELAPELSPYLYRWPRSDSFAGTAWRDIPHHPYRMRTMPEEAAELASDSRWPALFPAPICIVTTREGSRTAIERVVGPSIVNRFPYVMALSFCRQPLSARHYVRDAFMEILEAGGSVAVQFLPPGPILDRVLAAIESRDGSPTADEMGQLGLDWAPGVSVGAPIFDESYLVYEGRFVRPGTDFAGMDIFPDHARNIGSHRVYFFAISAIQLAREIATGSSAIRWRGLPTWRPARSCVTGAAEFAKSVVGQGGNFYQKAYTPHYVFPASNTVAFEGMERSRGRLVARVPPAPLQVEIDNDKARWPCFFPSSLGLITTVDDDATVDAIPCGSTAVFSRQPLIIGTCLSYAPINERYAPRVTLERIRRSGRFVCGVPFLNDSVVRAIGYLGNVSLRRDPDKVSRSGLSLRHLAGTVLIDELPIHYDCEFLDEIRLGTHIMTLGIVRRILVRHDVTADNVLTWCPWASIRQQQDKL